jgi:hypothetical protein
MLLLQLLEILLEEKLYVEFTFKQEILRFQVRDSLKNMDQELLEQPGKALALICKTRAKWTG